MYLKSRTTLALIFSFTFLFFANQLSATNYYIDSENGSDLYSGLAADPGGVNQGPWKSMTQMVEHDYLPGDSILFRRGGEWSDIRLKVRRGGEEGAYIYYGAYGTGDKPLIENAEINIDASYIIVENFRSFNSPKEGIERKTGTHIIIRNCDIYNAYANGIRVIGFWYEGFEDVLVEGCHVENSGIDNITVHKGDNYAEAGYGFTIRNNHCVGAGEEGYDLTTGSNILLENNTSENNGDGSIFCGMGVRDVIVRKHFSVNDRFSIMMKACSNVRIEYSIFTGVYRLLRMDFNAGRGASSNVEFYNNIFWQTGGYELARFKYSDGPITFKNNVFGGSSNNPFFFFEYEQTPAESGNFTFENNIYYHTTDGADPEVADFNGSVYTFESFKNNFSQEETGEVVNPDFPNYSGTFHLASDYVIEKGSSLIDKGTSVGAVEDFFGTPIQGIPDVGVVEVAEDGAFPVEWGEFDVMPDEFEPVVNVSWSTSFEINNQFFTVEKSVDQHLFSAIGTVESLGDGDFTRTYQMKDRNPQTGTMYYRIKQTDLDGNFSYSPITQIEYSQPVKNMVNLYPSLTLPGQDITITHSQSPESQVEVRLMDLHGRMLESKKLQANNFQTIFTIPSHVKPGYYVVTVAMDDTYKGFRVRVN